MKKKENLTKWEYWVLYGIDLHLKGGNHEERERRKDMVKRWRSDEEKKQDLALALDIIPDRISVTEKEALSGTIRYHYGALNLGGLISIDTDLTMPEEVGGGLWLNGLTSIKTDLTMPKEVGGHLDLRTLTSIKTKLTMPKKIGRYLDLRSLTSIDTDLTMPEEVGGDLYLHKLTSINLSLIHI